MNKCAFEQMRQNFKLADKWLIRPNDQTKQNFYFSEEKKLADEQIKQEFKIAEKNKRAGEQIKQNVKFAKRANETKL